MKSIRSEAKTAIVEYINQYYSDYNTFPLYATLPQEQVFPFLLCIAVYVI